MTAPVLLYYTTVNYLCMYVLILIVASLSCVLCCKLWKKNNLWKKLNCHMSSPVAGVLLGSFLLSLPRLLSYWVSVWVFQCDIVCWLERCNHNCSFAHISSTQYFHCLIGSMGDSTCFCHAYSRLTFFSKSKFVVSPTVLTVILHFNMTNDSVHFSFQPPCSLRSD